MAPTGGPSGKFSQGAANFTIKDGSIATTNIEIIEQFVIGTLPALYVARAQWRVRTDKKGNDEMTTTLTIRNAATAFAGAFISALLFVSAATSMPIA